MAWNSVAEGSQRRKRDAHRHRRSAGIRQSRCSRRSWRAATRSSASSPRPRSQARGPTRWFRRAEEKKLPVYRFPKYSDPEAQATLKGLNADIGVMAYVLLFAPPEFCAIPKHGMIQFHPSLLPLHRGPAAIPWAIIRGRSETGLTIFRPTPGLDEGPVILQKRVRDRPRRHRRLALFRQDLPARRRGAGAGGRPRRSAAAPPNGPRTKARRPTRAGCARPRAGSTGPTMSISSTT